MITVEEFIGSLSALQELLPMGKTISEPALAMAWQLTSPLAREQMTSAHLAYAIQQRVLDPAPATQVAITEQLLRYLYPLTNDRADPSRGMRPDLADRMRRAHEFHDLWAARPESQPVAQVLDAKLLEQAPADNGVMQQLDACTRDLRHAAAAVVDTAGTPLANCNADLAATLAAGSLLGYWSLQDLDRCPNSWLSGYRNLAREWIAARPNGWAAMQAAAKARQEGPSHSRDVGFPATDGWDASEGLVGASGGFLEF